MVSAGTLFFALFLGWLGQARRHRAIIDHSRGTDDRPCKVIFRIVCRRLKIVEVLARVGGLIFAALDEPEETGSQQSSEKWSHPVDPVFAREVFVSNARTEASSWVQGTTGIVDT